MRRDEFDHLIRAAGGVLDTRELIVIGSQSILGALADLDHGAVSQEWRKYCPDRSGGPGAIDRSLSEKGCEAGPMVTAYGVVALTFMMTMYALEGRHRRYVLGFALGCLLSSSYGFLSGAWPFGVVEAVWSVVAVRRYRDAAVTS